MNENFCKHTTLCWDCSKATGGCRWSDKSKPVEGWNAVHTMKQNEGRPDYLTYDVYECPEFVRDAYNGGRVWYKPDA